ncbi:MAG: transcription antitermination factor NusB [Bacteroidia bacterium]|nr:transcription antitermination factor NusB [Bacteroidia bacterium]MCX7652556.1 transcription antitermination factor NusB [Bacteroidia bacterium]MDW8417568.1 transcription antitermination factor NusB [Bacteroidia bacterium]
MNEYRTSESEGTANLPEGTAPLVVPRHKIRVRVMQAIYAYIVSETPAEEVYAHLLEELYEAAQAEAPQNADFLKELFFGVVREMPQLRSLIEQHLRGWTWDRLFMVDKSILLCGTYEITHFPDIPLRVTLNEWIEISKIYGTPRSPSFVNGLLDAIRRTLSGDASSLVSQKAL